MSPYKDRKIKITYLLNKEKVRYIIEDEGDGFDWKKLPNADPKNLLKRNGRGVVLIKMMMDDISYNDKGNIIEEQYQFLQ